MFDHAGDLDTAEWGHTAGAISGIRDAAIPWHAKLVACILISRARPVPEEGWTCWPGLKSIAEDCGISIKQVQRGLIVLQDEGLLTWKRGYLGRSNTYVLDFKAMMALRKPAKT